MSIDLQMTTRGDKELARDLRNVKSEFRKERVRAMLQILRELKTEVRKNLRGGALKRRSGKLERKLFERVDASTDDVSGRINPRVPYARAHELGMTIKPQDGDFLTIPIADEARGRGPRKFPNSFVAKSRAGNLILFQRRGDTIAPLFVLKKSFRIPKRPFLAPAVQRKQDRVVELMGDSYAASIDPRRTTRR